MALECGYCGGSVIRDEERLAYVHATDGNRVKVSSPGDYVSERHNHAGTVVLAVDVIDTEESE